MKSELLFYGMVQYDDERFSWFSRGPSSSSWWVSKEKGKFCGGRVRAFLARSSVVTRFLPSLM